MAVQPSFHDKPVDILTVSARQGKTRKSGGVQPVDKIARVGRAVKRPDEEPVRRAKSRDMGNLLPKQGRGFGLEPRPCPGKVLPVAAACDLYPKALGRFGGGCGFVSRGIFATRRISLAFGGLSRRSAAAALFKRAGIGPALGLLATGKVSAGVCRRGGFGDHCLVAIGLDRQSTRLNSRH